MHLQILHDTVYRYGESPYLVIQALRLWPAPSPAHAVRSWDVEVDGRRLRPTASDGFGNPAASHTIERDIEAIRIVVRAEVETRDLHGVQGDDPGTQLPPGFYLADTGLTACPPELADAAREAVAGGDSPLERGHLLCRMVNARVAYEPDRTDAGTTAAEAFSAGHGVCQDHAHVLVAAARSLGTPARYVSGYLCPRAGEAAASHAWAELHVDDLGWVGFDAANGQCPDAHYVRVACGRDYRDAAPVRGLHSGGGGEALEVGVSIAETTPLSPREQAQRQAQA